MKIDLRRGDCLELMKDIPDKSIDMILCDLPYGTTRCKWDTVIPFEPLWEQYKRIIKDNGAILLFSAQPFTTDLISSNRKMFRYEIIWEKTTGMGFLNANKMPLKAHENICVFYKKLPIYNPQKRILTPEYCKEHGINVGRTRKKQNGRAKQYGYVKAIHYTDNGTRFPYDVIKFSSWNGSMFGNTQSYAKHQTAKPVPLLKYLIKTYTNEGDLVLDNCMGSGSTGVACVNLNRDFIGIELDENYFNIAQERINTACADKEEAI